jgi:hypothetical protein
MVSRIGCMLVLTGAIMFGLMAVVPAQAIPTTAVPPRAVSTPELEPTAMASGLAILIGGVITLYERRRKNR